MRAVSTDDAANARGTRPGKRLGSYMKKKRDGRPQREIASQLGVPTIDANIISRYENGRQIPEAHLVQALIDVLGLDPSTAWTAFGEDLADQTRIAAEKRAKAAALKRGAGEAGAAVQRARQRQHEDGGPP